MSVWLLGKKRGVKVIVFYWIAQNIAYSVEYMYYYMYFDRFSVSFNKNKMLLTVLKKWEFMPSFPYFNLHF